MKKIYFLLLILIPVSFSVSAQAIFELKPSQSMSITGKGPGQDAAINPYSDMNSIGVVENIGRNNFTIRIQKEKEIIESISIKPGETKEVDILKGYQLYFDSKAWSKTKIEFKKNPR